MAKTETKTKQPTTPPAATTKSTPPPQEMKAQPAAEPSELVIKEIMIQKNVSREKAVDILKNPSK